MSVRIEIRADGLEDALKRLLPLLDVDPEELMTGIGAIGESQTRRRIEEEKTAPDGSPWQPNRAGTSILLETGEHLLGSIAFTADADEAVWGASWEYAHVHQNGMVITPTSARALRFMSGGAAVFAKKVTIPARPFVGLSDENREEILDLVTDVWGLR